MPYLNLFNSIDYLEPKCWNCGSKLDFGVNTKFDERRKTHVCMKCGKVVEEIKDDDAMKARDLEDYAV